MKRRRDVKTDIIGVRYGSGKNTVCVNDSHHWFVPIFVVLSFCDRDACHSFDSVVVSIVITGYLRSSSQLSLQGILAVTFKLHITFHFFLIIVFFFQAVTSFSPYIMSFRYVSFRMPLSSSFCNQKSVHKNKKYIVFV